MCIIRAAQIPACIAGGHNEADSLWLGTIGDAHPAMHFDVVYCSTVYMIRQDISKIAPLSLSIFRYSIDIGMVLKGQILGQMRLHAKYVLTETYERHIVKLIHETFLKVFTPSAARKAMRIVNRGVTYPWKQTERTCHRD